MHNERRFPVRTGTTPGTRLSLSFLEAAVPLTKSFVRTRTEIIKTPYPFVWEFTSHTIEVKDLPALAVAIDHHAALGHCLLKGTLNRELKSESRAGSTDTNSPTDWIVLDFDGLPSTIPDVDSALALMGLGEISYVVQYSASYGIADDALRAHVFMQLDRAYAAPLLKQWLTHLNHTVPALRQGMKLTKTGNSISWPLDISACQNDKLIYIAPPVLKGVKDPMYGQRRVSYQKRRFEKLPVNVSVSTEKNKELTSKRIAELREMDGLPKRAFKYKMHGSQEILIKPDSATITEMKQERGFVYFNLNGGDSWAYYHPETNPEFIYNFKGEPTYLTKELLPDYWNDLTAKPIRTGSDGISYLAFCDRATSAYWRGTYDGNKDVLELHMAKNETQVRHFAKQYGLPLGDFIPEWDLAFNPRHTGDRVDFNTRTINQFSPTVYMRTPPKPAAKIPPIINRVIRNALGDDELIVEHFLNWLAFILQYRDRTSTAWILHGTTGTGKGVLMTSILRPIFGISHTTSRRMEELNEQYNHFMRNSLLVFVDEVQTKALQNERGVMAKLKNFITEEFITIRAMYQNAMESRNYTNWIFASNMPDPVAIDREDRRFNVGRYQANKLQITEAEVAKISSELQAFHDFLVQYPCDKDKAMSVLDTADRESMIALSESSIDTVAGKLLDGDFEFLVDQLPAGKANFQTDFKYLDRLTAYQVVLRTLIERTDDKMKVGVAREELRVILDFIVGNMPLTPNKFTTMMKHHRIHIDKIWLDNQPVSGIKLQWSDVQRFPEFLDRLTPKVNIKSVKEEKKEAKAPKPNAEVAANVVKKSTMGRSRLH